MSLVRCIVLFGLLQRLCDAQECLETFTVELTEAEITNFEGDMVEITVRLHGQISGEVDVELLLLTESEFQNIGEGNGFTADGDPAERADFSNDDELVHTFLAVSSVSQMFSFMIDIVDDDRNELEEQFVAYVNVTQIQNSNDCFLPEESDRLYAKITIGVDPDHPDKTEISIEGSTTVSEGTMGWVLTLRILGFYPEDDIEVSIGTQGTSNNQAMQSSDYNLLTSSVTLTSETETYSVRMNFIEDDIPEPQFEHVEVTFSGGDRVFFMSAASITVNIEDNDDILIGFTESRLTIKEGGTGEAVVAILTPGEVAVSVSGQLRLKDRGTSLPVELPPPLQFDLSQQNREQRFAIEIPNDDVVDTVNNHERQFSIDIVITSGNTQRRSISPDTLQVVIRDNDTDVEFGIRDGVSMQSVQEGGEITITVGFLGNFESLKLDEDFVVGYSVKIFNAGDDLETTNIPDGVLTNAVRSRDIIIKTKSNEEVQDNRQFVVIIEQTSVNSPLVKLRSANLSVIIEDDDLNAPNKPTVKVDPLNDKEFQISWDIVISENYPVSSYRIELILPNGNTVVLTENDPTVTSITHTYIIEGVDYSETNISVRVCAIDREKETCSDREYHKGVEQGDVALNSPEGGISGGGIAAIVIVLLLLFCVGISLLLLLLYFCHIYCWKTYYPIIREKKYEEAFPNAREEFSDDV